MPGNGGATMTSIIVSGPSTLGQTSPLSGFGPPRGAMSDGGRRIYHSAGGRGAGLTRSRQRRSRLATGSERKTRFFKRHQMHYQYALAHIGEPPRHCFAGGEDRIQAILAALRGHWISGLGTDQQTARRLLVS